VLPRILNASSLCESDAASLDDGREVGHLSGLVFESRQVHNREEEAGITNSRPYASKGLG
jgi:hypothetical protein